MGTDVKKCPYCAEEIQDEAILCRYCKSDLTVPPPAGAASRDMGTAAVTSVTAGAAPREDASVGGATEPETPSAAEATTSPGETAEEKPPTQSDSFAFGQGARATPPDREAASADTDPAVVPAGAAASDPAPTSRLGDPATDPGAPASAASAADDSDAAASDAGAAGPVTYTHSGHRYVLGYGGDFFGIWDRQAPSAPVERFPRSDDGWRQAWQRYAGLEPGNVAVAATGQAAASAPAGSGQAMQYTHSGQRYLLGYGADFFGIWDRQNLSSPVQRYPRTDDGWRAAWQQFATWEPQSSEVGIGGSG